MSEHVRVERRGGVLAITLDRAQRRNAITVATTATTRPEATWAIPAPAPIRRPVSPVETSSMA